MKKLKYILAAALTAVTMSTAFTGCQDNEIFDVNAPEDLDARIDEAASRIAERERLAREAEEAKRNAILEKLQDDVYQVGNTDNGGAFWQTFSKSYKISSTDEAFMIKFKNFTSGANTYHNFGVVVTNDVEHQYGDGSVYPAGAGYAEYAVVRADNFKNWAWGNENGVGWNTSEDSGAEQKKRLKTSYDATEAEDKKFSEQMEGADCEVLITRAGDTINMSFTMTTWAGATLTKSFFLKESGIADKDIRVFLITEKGHFVVYKVSTEALEVPLWSDGVIFTEDQKDNEGISKVDPRWRINSLGEVASLKLDNYKKAIVHLDEAEVSEKSVEKIITSYIFDKKTSTAKLIYKNGAELECETSKISFFSSDDFTTPGEKTIYATYNAKSGEREVPVMTSFTVTVTPPISSIEVEAVSTTYYYAPGTTTPPTKDDIDAASFIKAVNGKTGVVDIPISAEDYTVEVTSEPTSMSGKFVITVTYKDMTANLEVALQQMESKTISLAGKEIGDENYSNDFCSELTQATKVAVGSGVKFNFTNKSAGTDNYKNFIVVLSNSEAMERFNDNCYGVMRADYAAWGHTSDGISNWNWECSLFETWNVEANWVWDGDDTHSKMREAISDSKVTVEIINKGSLVDVKCTIESNKDNQTYFQNYLNIPVSGDVYAAFSSDHANLIFE